MEFDYIVVGAGSAGCVVANRLSADPRNRVLLIEAGGKALNPLLHVPIGFGRTMHSPAVSWNFETEPDLGGRSRKWPRGKVMGGSSAINGLLYIRGQSQDYDHWRQLGCEGWGYADVLPFFRKSEDHACGEDPFHGVGGALSIEYPAPIHPVTQAFVAACGQAGIPFNADPNGAEQEGAAFAPVTVRKGMRCSASTAFITPIRHRRNFCVEKNATVCGVAIADGRVRGVHFRQANQRRFATARREVILCAGAIGSPQILMLSGIGDPAHLADQGIAPLVERAGVGGNLQDHLAVMVIAKLRPSGTYNEIVRSPAIIHEAARYAFTRQGMLASGAAQVVVFCKSDERVATPDIQLHMLPASTSDYAGGSLDPFPALTCAPCQLRPESRGTVRLKSADPRDAPAIAPKYLSAPADRAALLAGVRISRRILAQQALASHFVAEVMPGPDLESDAELLAWAAETAESVYHPVGTCRMGADPGAVVDPRLRVRGIEALRVADASIMPTLVSGNTNAPCIMIGEKAAAMILEDARS